MERTDTTLDLSQLAKEADEESWGGEREELYRETGYRQQAFM